MNYVLAQLPPPQTNRTISYSTINATCRIPVLSIRVLPACPLDWDPYHPLVFCKLQGCYLVSNSMLAVRQLREELQLLQEPGSYVGEIIKVMGKKKVLVKVPSPMNDPMLPVTHQSAGRRRITFPILEPALIKVADRNADHSHACCQYHHTTVPKGLPQFHTSACPCPYILH